MKQLVSVIVPVYNVEKYLRQCLNSVITQTYSNLEVLIVDDGSTDDSGRICDEYATSDIRVKVYHTNNKGLSAARNYGLDHCYGDYVFFIDSDDWMEREAIELLLNSIQTEDADIAVCSNFIEWKNHRDVELTTKSPIVSRGDSIVREYLRGCGIGVQIWNKLYRKEIFDQIRFPEGRVFEDYATTYRLLDVCCKLIRVQKPLVHYRMRLSSIGKLHDLNILRDCWTSCYERYQVLVERFEDCRVELMSACIYAIGRFWVWYYVFAEKASGDTVISDMQQFVREHECEIIGNKRYSFSVQFLCFIARYSNRFVFWMLYCMNQAYRKAKFGSKKMFE